MSSIQQNSNVAQTQAKAEEWLDATKESASEASEQASQAAHSAGQQAQQNKDQAAGFLQQTGEQMMNMAQGAVDSVKQTLGMDKK